MQVAVVDHNMISRDLTVQEISHNLKGVQVQVFRNAGDFLDAIEAKWKPDVVVMDCVLPFVEPELPEDDKEYERAIAVPRRYPVPARTWDDEIGGCQLAEQLRHQGVQAPIIMYTATSRNQWTDRIKYDRSVVHVPKSPVGEELVWSVVAGFLGL